MRVLRSMPKPMLLVLRNFNTVRAICAVHGHPVDRYTLNARMAARGVYYVSPSADRDRESLVATGDGKSINGVARPKTRWMRGGFSRLWFEWRLLADRMYMRGLIFYLRFLQFFGVMSDNNVDAIVGMLKWLFGYYKLEDVKFVLIIWLSYLLVYFAAENVHILFWIGLDVVVIFVARPV